MNTSDMVLEHPVELADFELDTASAAISAAPTSPIVAPRDDVKSLAASILFDLGRGRPIIYRPGSARPPGSIAAGRIAALRPPTANRGAYRSPRIPSCTLAIAPMQM